jgi:S1-C subfamily serine protease
MLRRCFRPLSARGISAEGSFRRGLAFAALALATLAAADARAQYAEVIERVKPSVVVVGTHLPTRNPAFAFRGTGFAVGDGTLIVTNAHVLPATLESDKLENFAILLPGEGKQVQGRTATRVAFDPDHDLAVLKVSGTPLPALRLAGGGAIREGDTYLFTGYPIGNVLGAYPVTHRAMIASVVPIALPSANASQLDPKVVRRLSSGPFQVYQLDATAYPGNSGSPLFSATTGEVIGVINMVLVRGTREAALSNPSGISYAIPAVHLRRLLETVK